MNVSERIAEKSFNLFMQYGIKSISMNDIAQSLGISKKTIYTVYDNKNDLVKFIIISYLENDEKEMN